MAESDSDCDRRGNGSGGIYAICPQILDKEVGREEGRSWRRNVAGRRSGSDTANAHFISMHYGSAANCSRSAPTGISIKFGGNQIKKSPYSFYDPVGMQFQHYIFCLIQKDLESSPPLPLTANNRPLNIPHGRNSRRARFHAFVTIVPRARAARRAVAVRVRRSMGPRLERRMPRHGQDLIARKTRKKKTKTRRAMTSVERK